ncbi:adenylate/guanylate cyclase domain-containing protein [Deinococcus maricopensis]|uniref:Putative adenylate/guanylate cyclase n=1 Tax=Deinococcus maricopensis (strain DSM 21211 / LMG 22137 / NRRL B-23946 / LB-34) TaxID=709986 RepID=E8U5A7_DEIML|nr:adenylate/guanylate cyclase domain-containing protein [Deinococcus maricopensis]ADV66246.1 putative adenylate/guanylate cyclase [Deinococcus maricopensis DSM 21211]
MTTLLLPSSPGAPSARRPVCAVVVDLAGSTSLAHRLPLEHYTAVMGELMQVLYLHLEMLRGHVLQHQGDAVICLWDIEDTPYALEAALTAHARAADLSLARLLGEHLQLRCGVACGEVMMGVIGGIEAAYGLPVNLARRLCDAGQRGWTLTCANTPLYAPHAELTPSDPLPLRGFPEPCLSYRASASGVSVTGLQNSSHMKIV